MADNRPQQNQNPPKQLTKEEELKKRLEEEREAAETAAAAAELAEAKQIQQKALLEAAKKPQVIAGDVMVRCLKSESFVVLGRRRYEFVKGKEIAMDPSHAEEMQQSEWVLVIG